jgi:hypothetical protein
MPRTEKRFGVVNQPASTAVEELVPSAATTRNLLINATARSTAVISAAIYTGAFSNDATGNIAITSISTITMSNASASPYSGSLSGVNYFGKNAGANVVIWSNGSSTGLAVIDEASNTSKYAGALRPNSGAGYWRVSTTQAVTIKQGRNNDTGYPKLTSNYVAVSETDAIGIGVNMATSATANSDMFDRVGINHVVGISINDSTAYNVGQTALQGVGGTSGEHGGGAYALQNGVGYLMHFGANTISENTSGKVGLGLYIFGPSSTSFEKRAYWNLDGVANKTCGAAVAYFVASDYNSAHQVFAFSQPSTTTLWSGISPTSSTSWPAGYALPSEAAPAGFRIVSNSGTTDPETNFLTGTITYPSAPTGVTVPTFSTVNAFQTVSLKFSPDGTKLAVAYFRNYSGSGYTNSVVVVYTRQNDGTWLHTNSSGSAIPYMPHNEHSMSWSADGSTIAVSGTASIVVDGVSAANIPFFVHRWFVGNGTSSIQNSAITSWSVASSKYPDFPSYTSPKSGNSTISSISVSASSSTATPNSSSSCSINGIVGIGSALNAGSFKVYVHNVLTASPQNSVYSFVNQASGTVGTSGQAATNYVTSVITDLPLAAGQTSQVSNIVLGSGERLYVSSSTSDSVDISAHGIEST